MFHSAPSPPHSPIKRHTLTFLVLLVIGLYLRCDKHAMFLNTSRDMLSGAGGMSFPKYGINPCNVIKYFKFVLPMWLKDGMRWYIDHVNLPNPAPGPRKNKATSLNLLLEEIMQRAWTPLVFLHCFSLKKNSSVWQMKATHFTFILKYTLRPHSRVALATKKDKKMHE